MLRQSRDFGIDGGVGAVVSAFMLQTTVRPGEVGEEGDVPNDGSLPDSPSVPLQCSESKSSHLSIYIIRRFRIGECSIGSSLLKTVEVGDASCPGRSSGITEQTEDAALVSSNSLHTA